MTHDYHFSDHVVSEATVTVTGPGSAAAGAAVSAPDAGPRAPAAGSYRGRGPRGLSLDSIRPGPWPAPRAGGTLPQRLSTAESLLARGRRRGGAPARGGTDAGRYYVIQAVTPGAGIE